MGEYEAAERIKSPDSNCNYGSHLLLISLQQGEDIGSIDVQ